MPRSGLRLFALFGLLLLGAPTVAQAQTEDSIFAPFVGFTTGGDTNTSGFNFGFSSAWLADNNWGAEFDVSHSTAFNDVEFEQTGLTTVMFNLLAAPKVTRQLRPYGVAGLGVIRARGCSIDCVREVSRTDLGLDLGGGVMWALNDIWGLRGDVRYFRFAQIHRDLPRLDNGPFDFWRIAFGGTITW